MDSLTATSRWLALVRLATGAVFVYMGTGHLLGGVATAEGFQKMITGFARADPLQPYTSVMVPIVLSAPAVFGALFVFGMIATGLALALGLFTRAALLAGMWVLLAITDVQSLHSQEELQQLSKVVLGQYGPGHV